MKLEETTVDESIAELVTHPAGTFCNPTPRLHMTLPPYPLRRVLGACYCNTPIPIPKGKVPMKNQTDIYEKITASIIKAGCGKFEMPWHTFGSLPSNATNKRRYRGINVLVSWATTSQRGYKTQLWATYQQWRELGAGATGRRNLPPLGHANATVTMNIYAYLMSGDDGRAAKHVQKDTGKASG